MTDSSPPPLDDRLRELLTALVEGHLTDDQQNELEHRVAADPAARNQYIDILTLHALLTARSEPATTSFELSGLSDRPLTKEETVPGSLTHRSPRSSRNRRNLTFGLVAGFIFLAALIGWAAFTYLPGIAKNENEPTATDPDKVIAWLMNTHDVKWAEGGVPESTRYKHGTRLAMEEGLVEILYATGARVVLEGPAEFFVGATEPAERLARAADGGSKNDRRGSTSHGVSHNSGFLKLGKLVARCDTAASKGFTIATPTTRVVDVSTEFMIAVTHLGKTHLRVYEGKVLTSPARSSNDASAIALAEGDVRAFFTESDRWIVAPGTIETFVSQFGQPQQIRTLSPRQERRILRRGASKPDDQYLSVHHVDSNDSEQRSLLQFDLSRIPAGYHVKRAELMLTRRTESPLGNSVAFEHNDAGQPIEILRITAPWSADSVNWMAARHGTRWKMPGGDVLGATGDEASHPFVSANVNPAPGETVRLDVTSLVEKWRTGEVDNHGMLLRAGKGNRLHFYSSRHSDARGHPRLVLVLVSEAAATQQNSIQQDSEREDSRAGAHHE